MGSNKRAALYARVSTDDKGQDNETQLMHLREEARRRGYDIVKEYTDESSGKTVKGRVGYQSMMSDAKKRRFDVVMAYKLDRFHRNTLECLTFVNEIATMDVELVVTSQNIDTTTAAGRAMMQMIAVFAELESANTSERVKIGLERAKAQGKVCHRKKTKLSQYQIEKARAILAENPGISERALAAQFNGISRSTLINRLREAGVLESRTQSGGKGGSADLYKDTSEKTGGSKTPPFQPQEGDGN